MNIGIVGLGLIGGTIAKSLKSQHHVSAYDISEDTFNYALDNKIIKKGDNVLLVGFGVGYSWGGAIIKV